MKIKTKVKAGGRCGPLVIGALEIIQMIIKSKVKAGGRCGGGPILPGEI